MSLYEVLPTLEAIKGLLEDNHDSMIKYINNGDKKIADQLFPVEYNGKFARLAREIGNQIKTANRPYTVAIVGEFKVGKSTLLNGLLGLSGKEALSTEATPDTACSILLRGRSVSDPECMIHFRDRPEPLAETWERAKQLTSQPWLDKHPNDAKIAEQLVEVEYFINTPFLSSVNLNDLPGTGSRYWREHTQRTHESMKAADAVIWVIGDEEPSADARKDLDILRECSQSVIPILNVREDPSAQVPILRDEAEVDDIAKAVVREFRQFFAKSFSEPLRVSARVIELEMSKSNPDKNVLESAGFNSLVKVFDEMILLPSHGQAKGRLSRIIGSTLKLATDADSLFQELKPALRTAVHKSKEHLNDHEDKLADLDDTRIEIQARVKVLARQRAEEIVSHLGGLGKLFVADTLKLSNFEDIKKALSKRGRSALNEDLKDRFVKNYLQLDKKDNWLRKLSLAYAQDVRDVALSILRHVSRTVEDIDLGTNTSMRDPDYTRISEELVQAVNAVVLKILSIGAAAGLLALIPGTQIIDAVGVVGLLIISAFHDPLEAPRRRAVEKVYWQLELQKYAVADDLIQCANEGTNDARQKIKALFESQKTLAQVVYDFAHLTYATNATGMDRLAELVSGLHKESE